MTLESVAKRQKLNKPPTFSQDLLDENIALWLVEDSVAFYKVESKRFREMLGSFKQFTNFQIKSADYYRSKVTVLFQVYQQKMKDYFTSFTGKVSFTSDCWTSPNRYSFMSVTAHFVGEDFVLRSLLLDFIPMNKAHSGTYLAECFLRSVEVFGLEKRIGTLTMDNASNNQKMHKALQVELGHKGIKFELNQALPCFDHIINLAVQDFIKVLEPKRKSKEINGRDKPLQEDQELDEEDLDEAEEELDEAEAEGWIHSLRKLLYSIKKFFADCRREKSKWMLKLDGIVYFIC